MAVEHCALDPKSSSVRKQRERSRNLIRKLDREAWHPRWQLPQNVASPCYSFCPVDSIRISGLMFCVPVQARTNPQTPSAAQPQPMRSRGLPIRSRCEEETEGQVRRRSLGRSRCGWGQPRSGACEELARPGRILRDRGAKARVRRGSLCSLRFCPFGFPLGTFGFASGFGFRTSEFRPRTHGGSLSDSSSCIQPSSFCIREAGGSMLGVEC
jgi:hypothetical protein